MLAAHVIQKRTTQVYAADGDEDASAPVEPEERKKKPAAHVELSPRHSVASVESEVALQLTENQRRIQMARRYDENTAPYTHGSGRLLLNPKSPALRKWDLVMVVLLCYVAVWTPFEVAFMKQTLGLFALNRVVDCFFLADVVKMFITPYFSHSKLHWVASYREIAANYAQGWLLIDIASILPFDLWDYVMEAEEDEDEDISSLRIIKVVRLLRLLKLFRIFRATRIFARWHATLGIPYGVLAVAKCFTGVGFCAHWLACLWRMTPDLTPADSGPGWLAVYRSSMAAETGAEEEWTVGAEYSASLYYSISTMSTVGYGDVVATNNTERAVSTLIVCIGAFSYANIIGAVGSILARLDEPSRKYRQTMDTLTLFMEEYRLHDSLKQRLVMYFRYAKFIHRESHFKSLLLLMSPGLRSEVSLYCNSPWVEKVPFFNPKSAGERETLISALVTKLTPEAFCPREVVIRSGVPSRKMFIIQRGMATKHGHIKVAGEYFGENLILRKPISVHCVRALTYLDVHCLSSADLQWILDSYPLPETRKLIRTSAIRLALFREIVRLARALKRYRQHRPNTTLTQIVDITHQDDDARDTLDRSDPFNSISQLGDLVQMETAELHRGLAKANATNRQLLGDVRGTQERVAGIERRLGRVEARMDAKLDAIMAHLSVPPVTVSAAAVGGAVGGAGSRPQSAVGFVEGSGKMPMAGPLLHFKPQRPRTQPSSQERADTASTTSEFGFAE